MWSSRHRLQHPLKCAPRTVAMILATPRPVLYVPSPFIMFLRRDCYLRRGLRGKGVYTTRSRVGVIKIYYRNCARAKQQQQQRQRIAKRPREFRVTDAPRRALTKTFPARALEHSVIIGVRARNAYLKPRRYRRSHTCFNSGKDAADTISSRGVPCELAAAGRAAESRGT